uniref:uncharacterized protein LOC129496311 n=1 Tax=Nyctereutes procyonoides TaxID=34880 RepID=UPI002445362D|nr:uncharacterized protein LOC129496311 [Nyctereutes procyonoides]
MRGRRSSASSRKWACRSAAFPGQRRHFRPAEGGAGPARRPLRGVGLVVRGSGRSLGARGRAWSRFGASEDARGAEWVSGAGAPHAHLPAAPGPGSRPGSRPRSRSGSRRVLRLATRREEGGRERRHRGVSAAPAPGNRGGQRGPGPGGTEGVSAAPTPGAPRGSARPCPEGCRRTPRLYWAAADCGERGICRNPQEAGGPDATWACKTLQSREGIARGCLCKILSGGGTKSSSEGLSGHYKAPKSCSRGLLSSQRRPQEARGSCGQLTSDLLQPVTFGGLRADKHTAWLCDPGNLCPPDWSRQALVFRSQDKRTVRARHVLVTTVRWLLDGFITKLLQPATPPWDNARAVKVLCSEYFGSF